MQYLIFICAFLDFPKFTYWEKGGKSHAGGGIEYYLQGWAQHSKPQVQ